MSITDQIRAFVRDQRARLDNEPTLDALAVLERDVQPKALKFLRDAEALQRKYRDDATAYSAHVGDDLREAFDELARFVGELRGEGKAFAQCIERQASVNRERGASDAPSGTRGVRAPWLPTLSEY
ncbi:MAG: hypothetical protein KJ061_17335, partial [Vicinamibacteraceae bacterium]|nr:hypothetical protein [Vicinamibacteraceae bacterium]